jgi:23S rRNA (cytidine1920-2'-O)/16S rRNA (cytidine1409-2'-O)-methyltransferase
MVRRGLATNRTEAAQAIRSGKVMVSARLAAKAGMLVLPEEPISVAGPVRRFASRAGEKLEAALVGFDIDVRGRLGLDAGASTGGFVDCLLSRGAASVIAVDVGYGQLDWRLREDPRVTVLDRVNVRELQPDQLPYVPDVVTADLSFISLALVLPGLARCSGPAATFVLLVKPQFEAGPGRAPGGVVRDPAVWRETMASVARAAHDLDLGVMGFMPSPVRGRAGNVEFLMHAARASDPAAAPGRADDVEALIEGAVREARTMTSSSHA